VVPLVVGGALHNRHRWCVGTSQSTCHVYVHRVDAERAIVVLFLFVIMLLGVDQVENLKTEPLAGQRWVAGVVGVSLLGLLAAAIYTGADSVISRGEGIASNVAGDNPDANIQQLATSIFSDYVMAFEVTSILLVVAVVGTVLLSRRRTAGKP